MGRLSVRFSSLAVTRGWATRTNLTWKAQSLGDLGQFGIAIRIHESIEENKLMINLLGPYRKCASAVQPRETTSVSRGAFAIGGFVRSRRLFAADAVGYGICLEL